MSIVVVKRDSVSFPVMKVGQTRPSGWWDSTTHFSVSVQKFHNTALWARHVAVWQVSEAEISHSYFLTKLQKLVMDMMGLKH